MSNNIRKLRTDAGIAQNALADMAKVSVRTLQDWEAERISAVDVYKLHRIAKALDCTIEDLINFPEE